MHGTVFEFSMRASVPDNIESASSAESIETKSAKYVSTFQDQSGKRSWTGIRVDFTTS